MMAPGFRVTAVGEERLVSRYPLTRCWYSCLRTGRCGLSTSKAHKQLPLPPHSRQSCPLGLLQPGAVAKAPECPVMVTPWQGTAAPVQELRLVARKVELVAQLFQDRRLGGCCVQVATPLEGLPQQGPAHTGMSTCTAAMRAWY